MQNPTPKFKQSFIISEKPGYLSEKTGNFDELWPLDNTYFQLKFRTSFLLSNVYKTVLGIFFLYFLDLELLIKM